MNLHRYGDLALMIISIRVTSFYLRRVFLFVLSYLFLLKTSNFAPLPLIHFILIIHGRESKDCALQLDFEWHQKMF